MVGASFTATLQQKILILAAHFEHLTHFISIKTHDFHVKQHVALKTWLDETKLVKMIPERNQRRIRK